MKRDRRTRCAHSDQAVTIQLELRFALTLALSPRRGNHLWQPWERSLNSEPFPRWKKSSLSPGERAGVRASVGFYCIETAKTLQATAGAPGS